MKRSNKRGLILQEALKFFATKGFNGTSVDDICVAAHVGKPAIYYYFKSKAQLYRTAHAEACEKVRALNIWENNGDPETTFRNGLNSLARLYAADSALAHSINLLLMEHIHPEIDVADKPALALEPEFDKIRFALKRLCPAVTDEDLRMLVYAIGGKLISARQTRIEDSSSGIQRAQAIIDQIVEFTRRFGRGLQAYNEHVSAAAENRVESPGGAAQCRLSANA